MCDVELSKVANMQAPPGLFLENMLRGPQQDGANGAACLGGFGGRVGVDGNVFALLVANTLAMRRRLHG